FAVRSFAAALRNLRRCPSDRPSFSRSCSVRSAATERSMSLSRMTSAYFPRPKSRSHDSRSIIQNSQDKKGRCGPDRLCRNGRKGEWHNRSRQACREHFVRLPRGERVDDTACAITAWSCMIPPNQKVSGGAHEDHRRAGAYLVANGGADHGP